MALEDYLDAVRNILRNVDSLPEGSVVQATYIHQNRNDFARLFDSARLTVSQASPEDRAAARAYLENF